MQAFRTSITPEFANEMWKEFAAGQGPRISSLMELHSATAEGADVVVTAGSNAQMEALDEIRIPFARFLIEKTGNTGIQFKLLRGEMQETERRPYTDKEKLDFMLKKHPEWQEMIEKLHLRLP